MMTNEELRALAEKAREAASDNGHCGEGNVEYSERMKWQERTLRDLHAAASPDRVLALLDEVERLRGALVEVLCCQDIKTAHRLSSAALASRSALLTEGEKRDG